MTCKCFVVQVATSPCTAVKPEVNYQGAALQHLPHKVKKTKETQRDRQAERERERQETETKRETDRHRERTNERTNILLTRVLE